MTTGDMNLVQVATDIGLAAHLRLLLSVAGVDPNKAGRGKAPAVILAARAGHYDVIKVLREHKEKAKGDIFLQVHQTRILRVLPRSIGSFTRVRIHMWAHSGPVRSAEN